MKSWINLVLLAAAASAELAAWDQCGGNNYSGSQTCSSGTSCVVVNEWYSQCQPVKDVTTSEATSTPSTTLVTTTSASQTSETSDSSTKGVQYLGRINPANKELTWPGTGIRFSYNGNSAINLTANGSNSGLLIVDGTSSVIPSVTANIPLPTGNHSVEFRKRSETDEGSIFLQVDGQPAANRLIEFIGDSITVGYGLDGTLPCTNTAQLEDNPKTYAALAANSLGADYNVVAWSGKGIVRNYFGDNGPLMPELWTRYGANDADNSYTFETQAQVVVINLGTNDFGYLDNRDPLNATVYEDAIVDFVTTINGKYPGAKFFLMSSPMLNDGYPTAADAQHTTQSTALQNAANTVGGYFVDWPAQGSDVGCDYHPNAATHAAEAPVLANAIQGVMGW